MPKRYSVAISHESTVTDGHCIVAVVHSEFGIVGRAIGNGSNRDAVIRKAVHFARNNRRNGWLSLAIKARKAGR